VTVAALMVLLELAGCIEAVLIRPVAVVTDAAEAANSCEIDAVAVAAKLAEAVAVNCGATLIEV
jgi:hypothetical protein